MTTDIAALSRQCHDTGFEQGSIAACNAIIAYLNGNGLAVVAAQIVTAWEDGTITEPTPAAVEREMVPDIPVLLPTPPRPPKLGREQARGAGYSGDSCTFCQSMQVKRNGSCLVCEACGNTTGCS